MDLLRRALTDESVAQEDLVDRVKDRIHGFFERAERDFAHEVVNAEHNLKKIKKMLGVVDDRGELKDDPEPITLNAWAKWLVLDGQVVNDPDVLTHEMERLCELAQTIENEWTPAYLKALELLTTKVLVPLRRSTAEAEQGMNEVIAAYWPSGVDKLLSTREKLTTGSHVVEVRSSRKYLGIGSLWKMPLAGFGVEGFQLRISDEGLKRTDPGDAHFLPFSAYQVKRLLQGLEKLTMLDIQLARHDRFDTQLEKYFTEMDNVALAKFDKTDPHGDKSHDIIKYAEAVYHDSYLPLELSKQIGHIVQVSLKLCEISMRRMGSKAQ